MDRGTNTPAFVAEALALIAAPACACDGTGTIVAANAALAELVGGAVAGRPLASLFCARTGAAAVEIRLSLSGERRWDALIEGAPQGCPVEVRGKPLPGAAGFAGATFVFGDVLTFGDGQAALRGRLLEQAAVVEHAPVGIAVTLPDLVKSCNPRMAAMLGYAPEELVGHSPSMVFAAHPNTKPSWPKP